MKPFITFILIILSFYIIGNIFEEKVKIPEESIRLRVVANSNDEFYEKYYYISKNNIISIYDDNGNFIQTLSGNFILKISDKFFLVEISKIGYYRSQYQIYKINK